MIGYLEEIQDLRKKENKEKGPDASKHQEKNTNVSIPRQLEIKIPIFDGKNEEYPDFIASFKIATDHHKATKPQKFLVLRKHLAKAPLLVMT